LACFLTLMSKIDPSRGSKLGITIANVRHRV
jgi:hypothetical protein